MVRRIRDVSSHRCITTKRLHSAHGLRELWCRAASPPLGEVEVTHVRADKPITELNTRVVLADGTPVLDGTAVWAKEYGLRLRQLMLAGQGKSCRG